MRFRFFSLSFFLFFFVKPAFGLVKYDEGAIMIMGIQLLQDASDNNAYYYLPQYPKISTKKDNSLDLLCIKYIGQGGAENNGGIFHALIEFNLPIQLISDIQEELQKKVGKSAKLIGPVPLLQAIKDGEAGMSSFQVVSSILTNTAGANPFTRTLISSGHAPFLPGSKAAISAKLSQEGATLLFASLEGNTSDVSVTLSGYYEATVKAYNAVITAETSIIYNHFSSILNNALGFDKTEIRKVTDELIRKQSIKIDILDRSEAMGVNAKNLESIVSMITDKIVEVMFNAKEGWSKDPERVIAVANNQIPLRQERGAFSQFFSGSGNQNYITDNQFVLKNIQDIKTNTILINLSKATTIKVPVYTSGNLSGLYKELKEDEKYFKIVNLDDSDFQKREVVFQVDGEFAETFNDIFNFVTLSFRKKYANGKDDVTMDLVFDRKTIESGASLQKVFYPRLGIKSYDWLNYEYKLSWALKGDKNIINEPKEDEKWLSSTSSAILLSPPFDKLVLEIDADREFFKEKNIISTVIRFLCIINGKPQVYKTLVLKRNDTVNTNKIALYCDKGENIGYQVTWVTKEKEYEDEIKILESNYLILIPKL